MTEKKVTAPKPLDEVSSDAVGYVRVTRSGVYVELERFFSSTEGKAALEEIKVEGDRIFGRSAG